MTATRKAKEARLAVRRQLFKKMDNVSRKEKLTIYTLIVDQERNRWYSYVVGSSDKPTAARPGIRKDGELPIASVQVDSPLFAPTIYFSQHWGEIDPNLFMDDRYLEGLTTESGTASLLAHLH